MYSGIPNSFLMIAGSNNPTITLPIFSSLAANIMWSQIMPMSKSPEHFLSYGRINSPLLSRQTISAQGAPNVLYALLTLLIFSSFWTTMIFWGCLLQAVGATHPTVRILFRSLSDIFLSVNPRVVQRCLLMLKSPSFFLQIWIILRILIVSV